MQFGKSETANGCVAKNRAARASVQGRCAATDFEITADNYEENRHFFLARFFRDNYDANMSQLPNVFSGVTINLIEV